MGVGVLLEAAAVWGIAFAGAGETPEADGAARVNSPDPGVTGPQALASSEESGASPRAFGLYPGSVVDTPTPDAVETVDGFRVGGAQDPRDSAAGFPPQIPHAIDRFVPITVAQNACLGCHYNRDAEGRDQPGQPTAMPPSHYQDFREGRSVAAAKGLDGGRFLCTQCHSPKTRAQPIKRNLY